MKGIEHIKHVGQFLNEILLGGLMTAPVITIQEHDDFSRVEEIFVSKNIRHLPVVDEGGSCIGIVTQRDLYRVISPRKFIDGNVAYEKDIILDKDGYYDKNALNQFMIDHVMHKDPQCLTEENTLGEAIHVMVENKIGCVPIIDGKKKPVGIVTRFDILKISDILYVNFKEK